MAIEREGISVELRADATDFVGSVGEAISSLGAFRVATAGAAGAALLAFGAPALNRFASYETSLTNVALKHRLAMNETDALGDSIDDFRSTVLGAKTTQDEFAGALDAVADSSSSLTDSMRIAESAAALTASMRSGQDIVANAKMLDTLLDISGRNADHALRISDTLLAATRVYGGSVSSLGSDLIATKQHADLFNLSLEEQAFLLAGMGKKAPATDPKQLFTGLASLEDEQGPTAKALREKLGVLSHEGGKLRPMGDLLTEIDIAVRAITEDTGEQGRIIRDVFDRNGVAINAARMNWGEFQWTMVQTANATGEASAAIGETTQSVTAHAEGTESAVTRIKTAFTDLGDWLAERTINLADFISGEDMKVDIGPIETDLGDGQGGLQAWFDGTAIENIRKFVEDAKTWLVNLGPNLIAGIGDLASTLWNDIGPKLAIAYANVIAWRDGANAWLVGFVQKVAAGIGDLGSAIWNKLAPGLASVKQKFDSWMSQHPLLGSFIGGVPFVSPVVQTLQAIGPQTPQASSSSTTLVVENVSLPNVTNPESFARELQRMSSRASEFDSQYRSLSYRRGVVG